MRRSVLVTGASGFIGRPVLPRLVAEGYEVHAVHRSLPVGPGLGIRLHEADLLDPRAATPLVAAVRPTHLLHLAWHATPGTFWSAEENVDWTAASLRLVRAFAEGGGQRAVFAGTCAEYDLTVGRCSETTPRRPGSLYGVCKNALQEVVAEHARAAGYSSAWARLFHPYGPGEHPARLVPSVVRGLLGGTPVELSEGYQARDLVYVDDVAEALVVLLGSDLTGAVNVGTGVATSVRALVAAAEGVTGGGDVRFGARSPGSVDPPLIVADGSRLAAELDWSPPTGLREGLERTVSWWRDAS